VTVCTGTWGELPCTREARSGDRLCGLHAVAATLTGRATPAPAVPKPGAVPGAASSSQPPQSPATVQPSPFPLEQPTVAGDPRILDRFAVAVQVQGVVGEVATAQLVYLVLTSRLLDKPASLIVKGHSASGKSYTVQVALRFFPPEAVLVMTAMSQRALIYSDEEYAHRTIIMYEATGLPGDHPG
jgi:hypothetical protein